MKHLLLALAAILLFLPSAQARRIETWSLDQLRKEADVVVLATALESKDTRDRFNDRTWSVDFLGVDTTFAVESVLKGNLEGDRLTVLHYRLRAGVRVVNGPLLVAFRTKGMQVKLRTARLLLGRPSYLLFLKKRGDGRFEIVSGPIDPALAVREVYPPLPEEMETDE